MTHRISTAGMHNASVSAILEAQVKLAKIQDQVSTGKKFQTASDDPIGATRYAGLQRKLADNAQYARNSNVIQGRLSYEEQTLSDVTSMLQSARDTTLSGVNATLSQDERKVLATQVRQNLASLVDMANRQDSNGDNGEHDITLARTDVHTGADAFMGIVGGNGGFNTAVSAANSGDATIDIGTVSNSAAWVPDNYTLQFTSATDWQVVDSATPTPNVVA